jgi:hypothetical protein
MKKEISKKIEHTNKIPVYKVLPILQANGDVTPARSNLDAFKGKGGIYYIYQDNKLVYIGDATNDIKKTAIRHFQGWNDSQQLDRFSYRENILNRKHKYMIKFSIYEDAGQRSKEIRTIQCLLISNRKPPHNKKKYYHFYNTKFDKCEKGRVKKEIEVYNAGNDVEYTDADGFTSSRNSNADNSKDVDLPDTSTPAPF